VKTRENFRIYVQISGPNSNFRTFQGKFQNFRNFRTTPRPVPNAFPEMKKDFPESTGGKASPTTHCRSLQHSVTNAKSTLAGFGGKL